MKFTTQKTIFALRTLRHTFNTATRHHEDCPACQDPNAACASVGCETQGADLVDAVAAAIAALERDLEKSSSAEMKRLAHALTRQASDRG